MEARGSRLLRTAHLLCGDRHEAERLLGDALAKTWQAWRGLSTLAAAENLTLRRLVSGAREAVLPAPPASSLPAGLGLDPPERVAARGALRRRLATLSPEERAVLVLRHAEGLPPERVATVTGLSPQQVLDVEAAALAALGSDPDLAPYVEESVA